MAAAKVSLVTSSGFRLRQNMPPQQPVAPVAGSKAQKASKRSAPAAGVGSEPPSTKKGRSGGSVRSAASVTGWKVGGASSVVSATGKQTSKGKAPKDDFELLAVDAGGDGDPAASLDLLLPKILGFKEYSPGRELRRVFSGRKVENCNTPGIGFDSFRK